MKRRRRRARLGDAGQERFYRNVLAALREGENAAAARNCGTAIEIWGEAKTRYGAAAEALLQQTPTLDMRRALSEAGKRLRLVRERLQTKCLVRV